MSLKPKFLLIFIQVGEFRNIHLISINDLAAYKCKLKYRPKNQQN